MAFQYISPQDHFFSVKKTHPVGSTMKFPQHADLLMLDFSAPQCPLPNSWGKKFVGAEVAALIELTRHMQHRSVALSWIMLSKLCNPEAMGIDEMKNYARGYGVESEKQIRSLLWWQWGRKTIQQIRREIDQTESFRRFIYLAPSRFLIRILMSSNQVDLLYLILKNDEVYQPDNGGLGQFKHPVTGNVTKGTIFAEVASTCINERVSNVNVAPFFCFHRALWDQFIDDATAEVLRPFSHNFPTWNCGAQLLILAAGQSPRTRYDALRMVIQERFVLMTETASDKEALLESRCFFSNPRGGTLEKVLEKCDYDHAVFATIMKAFYQQLREQEDNEELRTFCLNELFFQAGWNEATRHDDQVGNERRNELLTVAVDVVTKEFLPQVNDGNFFSLNPTEVSQDEIRPANHTLVVEGLQKLHGRLLSHFENEKVGETTVQKLQVEFYRLVEAFDTTLRTGQEFTFT